MIIIVQELIYTIAKLLFVLLFYITAKNLVVLPY